MSAFENAASGPKISRSKDFRAAGPSLPDVWTVLIGDYDAITHRVEAVLRGRLLVDVARQMVTPRSLPPGPGIMILSGSRVNPEWDMMVRGIKRMRSDIAFILVTTDSNLNHRALQALWINDVVFSKHIESELPSLVTSVVSAVHHAQWAAVLASQNRLGAQLRDAVCVALKARPPLDSVRALAETVGCHRSTLAQQWRFAHEQNSYRASENRLLNHTRPELVPRLEDFVGWLVLLHAVSGKQRRHKWSAVANRTGIHINTLRRMAIRYCGTTLVQLDGCPYETLHARFSGLFLQPLLVADESFAPRD
jgi:hypothetical protein